MKTGLQTTTLILFMTSMLFGFGAAADEERSVREHLTEQLSSIGDLDLSNGLAVMQAHQELYAVVRAAASFADTAEARIAVDLVREVFTRIPAENRGFAAIADAALAEVLAVRFDQVEPALAQYDAAFINLTRLQEQDKIPTDVADSYRYFMCLHGVDMFEAIANRSHDPQQVESWFLRRNQLAETCAELEPRVRASAGQELPRCEVSEPVAYDWLALAIPDGFQAPADMARVWDRQGAWLESWLTGAETADALDMALVWFGNRFVAYEAAAEVWTPTAFPFLVLASAADDLEWEILIPLPESGTARETIKQAVGRHLASEHVRLRHLTRADVEQRLRAKRLVAHLPPDPVDAGRLDGDNVDFVAETKKPKIIAFHPPEYPEEARSEGLEGTVMIKVLVGARGEVLDAQVLRSVAPMLDAAALAAARELEFEPGKQRGIPVKAWMAIPYVFKLKTAGSDSTSTR